MKHVVAVVVVISLMGIVPENGTAQYACGDCKEVFDPWPMKEHKIPASELGTHSCGDGVGCHPDYQEGSCSVYQHWHDQCGPEFALELERLAGDLDAAYAALAGTELKLRPASEGGGVIVMGCDGIAPVAFVALSEEKVDRLMAFRSGESSTVVNSPRASNGVVP